MHTPKLPVERNHLLGMGSRVVALLPITGFWTSQIHSSEFQNFVRQLTLVLADAHIVDSQRAQHHLVHQAGHGNGGQGQQSADAVLGGSEAREAEDLTTFACGQGHDHGKCAL